MQEALHAPDAGRGRVRARDRPGGELLGEGAHVGPVAGAGVRCRVLCCGAEGGDLGRRDDRRDDHETVPVEAVEERACCHGGRVMRGLAKIT